jgi:hypothetical protein
MGGISTGVIDSAIKRFAADFDEETQNEIWQRLISYLTELKRKD